MADNELDLAEQVVNKIYEKSVDFPIVPTDRVYASVGSKEDCCLDDSGYIPVSRQVEQLEQSGQMKEMYRRMMYSNNSEDRVLADYSAFADVGDRLQLMKRMKEVADGLNNSVSSRMSVKAPEVTTSAPPSETVDTTVKE